VAARVCLPRAAVQQTWTATRRPAPLVGSRHAHAPWATSVGHWARIVREAEPRSGRGRACLGTLPQLGTAARALLCPPLTARDARRLQAHPRYSWRRTACPRDIRRLKRLLHTS